MAMACKAHRRSFFCLLPGATGHLLLALTAGATPTGYDTEANAALCKTKASVAPLRLGVLQVFVKPKLASVFSIDVAVDGLVAQTVL